MAHSGFPKPAERKADASVIDTALKTICETVRSIKRTYQTATLPDVIPETVVFDNATQMGTMTLLGQLHTTAHKQADAIRAEIKRKSLDENKLLKGADALSKLKSKDVAHKNHSEEIIEANLKYLRENKPLLIQAIFFIAIQSPFDVIKIERELIRLTAQFLYDIVYVPRVIDLLKKLKPVFEDARFFDKIHISFEELLSFLTMLRLNATRATTTNAQFFKANANADALHSDQQIRTALNTLDPTAPTQENYAALLVKLTRIIPNPDEAKQRLAQSREDNDEKWYEYAVNTIHFALEEKTKASEGQGFALKVTTKTDKITVKLADEKTQEVTVPKRIARIMNYIREQYRKDPKEQHPPKKMLAEIKAKVDKARVTKIVGSVHRDQLFAGKFFKDFRPASAIDLLHTSDLDRGDKLTLQARVYAAIFLTLKDMDTVSARELYDQLKINLEFAGIPEVNTSTRALCRP